MISLKKIVEITREKAGSSLNRLYYSINLALTSKKSLTSLSNLGNTVN